MEVVRWNDKSNSFELDIQYIRNDVFIPAKGFKSAVQIVSTKSDFSEFHSPRS